MFLTVKANIFEFVTELWIDGREFVQLFLSLSFIDGNELVQLFLFLSFICLYLSFFKNKIGGKVIITAL